jgi:hypothetical protein
MNTNFMHFHTMFFYRIKDSMIICCCNNDIKEDFLRGFGWPIFFYVFWIMVFFPLSPFFNECNDLEVHISNLSFP